MNSLHTHLRIGFGNYDRHHDLVDGSIPIPGVDPQYETHQIITEVFEGMVRERKYDVAELGLSYFLRTMDLDDPPFVAMPIFPVRIFRHSAIYINTAAGIRKPEDLAGKTVGEFAMYGHDAGVWPKGILSDDFGVKPEQCRWIVGGLDWPMKPVDFVPLIHPKGIDIQRASKGTDLGRLLEEGEINALISADVPRSFLEKSTKVARLFPDFQATEREYFKRTGIFPAMHTVVIRKELVTEQPDVLRSVYQAFSRAKDAAREKYLKGAIFNNMATMIPWFSKLIDEDTALLGQDWWPYGMGPNRKMIDTFLRYHFEQGLSKRRMSCEDIFVPDLL
jgi:4,5-dihydroxyphthalate decarboxylase